MNQSFLSLNPCALSLAAAVCLLAVVARAQEKLPEPPAAVPQPAAIEKNKVDEAVEKGLEYLASVQKPDGSFHPIVGVSSVAVMAFLASGHVPGEGKYHEVVERGIAYVVKQQDPKTGLLTGGGGRMYGHGMATLLLGEVVGMTHDDSVKKALPKAVEVILKAQAVNKPPQYKGGWRYEPTSTDSDMSVTGWQMIALRAAKDAGIEVPKQAIDDAVKFVKRCSDINGGFGYVGPGPMPTTTAIGVVALQMAGEYDAPEVWKGADYFLRNPLGTGWFYYTVYYGTFAMYQCGGKYLETWQSLVERSLLPKQRADGSWPPQGPDGTQAGPVYCTAMALLALSVQYHYLPAYQR